VTTAFDDVASIPCGPRTTRSPSSSPSP
jgi:hypothetical protein